MEQFDEMRAKGMKEKNMYILHLDTPRLIIIGAVFIGVIIISFLLGMNLTHPGSKAEDTFASKDALYDFPITENPADTKSALSITDEHIPGITPDTSKNSILPPDEKSRDYFAKNNESVAAGKNPASSDILTSDTIQEVIPPMEPEKRPAVENPKQTAKHKNIAKKEKPAKKHRIVEVSSKEKNYDASTHKKGYAVQVASFDKRAKALAEVESLKKLSYDSYIDRSLVNGKNYFRVRIGPIASKNKAVDVMKEIQTNSRYEESYLVKE